MTETTTQVNNGTGPGSNKKKNKKKKGKIPWQVKLAHDSSYVHWTDDAYQYTVQNPANHGEYLLKIQLYKHNLPIKSCGLFIDEDDAGIYKSTLAILDLIENLWIERKTNTPKEDGLLLTKMPLAAWRRPPKITITPATVEKRKTKQTVADGRGTKRQKPNPESTLQNAGGDGRNKRKTAEDPTTPVPKKKKAKK